MKRLLLLAFCAIYFPVMASHIVGGEFELTYHEQSGKYRIQLILYFDKIKGNPGAKDQFITVRIFRKRDNAVMRNVSMRLFSEAKVEYFQPHCSSGSTIDTDKLIYVIDNFDQMITLPASEFSDPQGYYLSWERCCRNYAITNVYSEDPQTVPGARYAGQTFYLEFPPVTKNGQPFINSSPRLFPPLSDYACPRKKYFVDFSGIDDDGDSLVYSLVTPLNTKSADALPPGGFPREGPYPSVQYRPSFSSSNIMQGAPDLQISEDGLLTVTPTVAGLFVFAVKCEEFRDGSKIGEVRRDFQMLVLQNCPSSQSPVGVAKPKGSPDSSFKKNLTVSYANTVSDEDRCVEVRVTDDDSKSQDNNFADNVSIKAIPIGFKTSVNDVLPSVTQAKIENGGDYTFSVCFPQCPHRMGPYTIGIVIFDKACPLPNSDTVFITVNITPPPNHAPQFDKNLVTAVVEEGSSVPVWEIIGTDQDSDPLTLTPDNETLTMLNKYGFTFTMNDNEPGNVNASLSWNTQCDEVDFSDKVDADGKVHLDLKFILEDVDKCLAKTPDVMEFKLTMDLVDVHPPRIEYAPEPGLKKVEITRKVFESVTFNVNGVDVDADDPIALRGNGVGFKLSDYGISFPKAFGLPDIASTFNWAIQCNRLNINTNKFDFQFIVVDSLNKCGYHLTDILEVTVIVEPPDNTRPELSVSGSKNDLQLSYTLGDEINLQLIGTDIDINPKDQLKIEIIEATGSVPPEGYGFHSTPSNSPVHGTFVWNPGCEIYQNQVYENYYTFVFHVIDDRCFNVKADTVKVDITIKDVENDITEFIPPNFISPNGDGLNDFFAMVRLDETTNALVSILPKDNCSGRFERITILNRWGREIFESTNRDFRWFAPDEPTGIYFYLLKFSDKTYKGTITVAYDKSQRTR